ncbi:MAG: hypothetical protein DI587_27170 [Variovorax paradoxus]|nr:MAG: hypothetical protein DI583_27170 [Variovorax paradoxus]PZQ04454.1 MAG: hypothetical protein DI587_27170 [Variovorax paradoxus]
MTLSVAPQPRHDASPLQALDHALHGLATTLTHGLSPRSLTLAFVDWLVHCSTSPGKQLGLAAEAHSLLHGVLRAAASAGEHVGDAAVRPGVQVAATPGKVVLRNRLIELIQHAPTTRTVRPGPALIVKSWTMEFYILDLSPGNSLVRHLVDRGHTVCMLSWRNPDAGDRNLDSPWRPVYKLHALAGAESTFVLASGGANAGIVSEPGHAGRSYRMALGTAGCRGVDPDSWLAEAAAHQGSWWTAWGRWLGQRSGRRVAARWPGGSDAAPAIGDAPGTDVTT